MKIELRIKNYESRKIEIYRTKRRGRSYRIYKENFGDEVIISLTAFSNFKGGKVLLGVNDQGKIKGVQISKESIQKWTNEIRIKQNRI